MLRRISRITRQRTRDRLHLLKDTSIGSGRIMAAAIPFYQDMKLPPGAYCSGR